MWDERYSSDEYAYGTTANDFLVQKLEYVPKGRVLCLAEGEGRNAVYLAEQGCDVIAVDSSTAGMKKAQRLAAQRNVNIQTITADLNDFIIEDASYDAIISIFCHLPVELRLKLHKHIVSGLKPGGVLLLEAYTPEQLVYKTGGPAIAELTMRLDELLIEFKELEIIHAEQLVREVIEGKFHTGTGSVVQLVARKK